MQEESAKEREREGREPHIAQRLQKKVAKRVQFLENVASSKRQASLAVQGTLKKKRKKDRVGKRLGDLSQLAASLHEAAQLVRPGPFRCMLSISTSGLALYSISSVQVNGSTYRRLASMKPVICAAG